MIYDDDLKSSPNNQQSSPPKAIPTTIATHSQFSCILFKMSKCLPLFPFATISNICISFKSKVNRGKKEKKGHIL